MSITNGQTVLGRGEVSDFLSKITTKAILVLLAVFIAAVVQSLRHGLSTHYVVLLVGSTLSAVALFAYGLLETAGRGKRGLVPMLVTLAGFIPYLFGCDLVFYEGFWRLRYLLKGFSPSVLFVSLCFMVGGYLVVRSIHRLTVLADQIKSGAIIIQDS